MAIFKQYGIQVTADDHKDFLDFLSLGASKNHFNLDNLCKIFDILSKILYTS